MAPTTDSNTSASMLRGQLAARVHPPAEEQELAQAQLLAERAHATRLTTADLTFVMSPSWYSGNRW